MLETFSLTNSVSLFKPRFLAELVAFLRDEGTSSVSYYFDNTNNFRVMRKGEIFRDVTERSLVDACPYFGGTCCLHQTALR